jgi:membrane-bound lytic murein transglycosylase A
MASAVRAFRYSGAAAACLWAAAATPVWGSGLKIPNARMEPVAFAALDGWAEDDHAAAFGAFLKSCGAILNGTKAMRAARPVYGGLFKVCERARAAGELDREQARKFFEENFNPVQVSPLGESDGFLTGYYETEIDGARFPSDEYKYPIYAKPSNLRMPKGKSGGKIGRKVGRRHVVPYYDRNEIEDGALAGRGLEICFVKSPIDAFFAQIQGSTRVRLDTGGVLRLNYDAHNGMPYTPVGKFLIERGIVSKEDMSMDKIRDYMEANPKEGDALRRKNRSFVFFRQVPLSDDQQCVGAQGVPLTPMRSLAMDRKLHVYGTPFWIEAKLPIESEKAETPFRQLLIAQDTGSAIVGPARADIYFGYGEEIGHVAGRIKQHGRFVMLVPSSITIEAPAEKVPLPKARPTIDKQEAAVPAEPTETTFPPPKT